MIVWFFPLIAACSVSTAYFIKIRLSGENLNHTKLYFGLAFNTLFAVPYINIVQHNDFPHLGYRPDIISDHPFIGWIAFICIFLHSFACPVKREVKCWLSKK
jgi:hypothetical protein